jgi:arylsulfatase A-like enzyme
LRWGGYIGLGAAIAVALSCAGEDAAGPEQALRKVRVPLVSWRHTRRTRRSVQGSPRSEWIRVDGARRAAIVGEAPYGVQVRLGAHGPGHFRGACAVRGKGGATFRARLTDRGGTQRLLEMELSDGGGAASPFEVDLPAGEDSWIDLEVASEGGAGSPLGVWVAPVVETVEKWGTRPPPGAPNVLLITLDTTRRDELGTFGGSVPTPALDALAADGVVFSQAYAVAFNTEPSHASLLTGSYAREHGVHDNNHRLVDERTTLAEVLRAHGWATAGFVSSSVLVRRMGMAQGFDFFDDSIFYDPRSDMGTQARVQRRLDRTTAAMRRWLDRGPREPFFAWLHAYDPHQPYFPPRKERGPLEAEAPPEVLDLFVDERGVSRGLLSLVGMDRELTRDAAHLARAYYRGEIAFLDEQIGALLDDLRRRGLYDEMLVVVVSDHGESFLDRGPRLALSHASLHGEVTHLPLILKLPASLGGAVRARYDGLVGNLDIAPTLLEILGIEVPPSWTGKSFWTALQAGAPFRDFLVLEGRRGIEAGVRSGRYSFRQLLLAKDGEAVGYSPGRRAELYDVAADPAERNDLSEELPGEVRRMRGLIDAFYRDAPSMSGVVVPEQREALRALGYLEPGADTR